MASLFLTTETPLPNPLSIVEHIVCERDLAFERPAEDELVAELLSSWCNYRIWFTWQETLGALLFGCAFESKIAPHAAPRIYPLLAQVNEKMWLGHFDYCPQEGTIAFRHSLLLRGAKAASSEQIEDLLDIALCECERFFPAVQSVLWGGKSPEEALSLAMFETVGQA